MEKTLTNTTAKGAKTQVKDIEFWGNGDTFKLISKASSQSEGWMKSTKAMEIIGVGCVVQVTTQQKSSNGMLKAYTTDEVAESTESGIPLDYSITDSGYVIAEALTFVPGVMIEEDKKEGKVVSRKLISIINQ